LTDFSVHCSLGGGSDFATSMGASMDFDRHAKCRSSSTHGSGNGYFEDSENWEDSFAMDDNNPLSAFQQVQIQQQQQSQLSSHHQQPKPKPFLAINYNTGLETVMEPPDNDDDEDDEREEPGDVGATPVNIADEE